MKKLFNPYLFLSSFFVIIITIALCSCSDSDEPEPNVYEYLATRSHCSPLVISVEAGQTVTISTTGTVVTHVNGDVVDCDMWTDANGIPNCHYVNERLELHNLPFMALIGMFDNEYFLVGTSFQNTFNKAGNLELSVNDWGGCNDESDNDGKFSISVLIE